jgi:hypothetical protein
MDPVVYAGESVCKIIGNIDDIRWSPKSSFTEKQGGYAIFMNSPAPALSDDDVVPVRGLLLRGSHSGGGKTPFLAYACN